MSEDRCILCHEPIPKLAIGFSNSVAIETNQYCSWICMLSKLGREKAYAILENKVKELKEKRLSSDRCSSRSGLVMCRYADICLVDKHNDAEAFSRRSPWNA